MTIFIDDKSATEDRKKGPVFDERKLYPLLSAEELLSSLKHRGILDDIKKAVAAPKEYFSALYQSLINNFAEFVQFLPTTNNSVLGSILNDGLHRAWYVVDQQSIAKDKLDPLWIYVLFSAALLFDVAQVNAERTVILSTKEGAFVAEWLPHEKAMSTEIAAYYRIRRGGGMPSWLGRKMTHLLAYNLMPEAGFRWIAENPQALHVWLALLSDDKAALGGFRLLLNKSLEYLHKLHGTKEFFMPLNIEDIEAEETVVGEEFLEWLKEGIEKGTITVNEDNSLVHVVDEGLFLEEEIFAEFSKNLDKKVVVEQLHELGYMPLDKGGASWQQYEVKKAPVTTKIGRASAKALGAIFAAKKSSAVATKAEEKKVAAKTGGKAKATAAKSKAEQAQTKGAPKSTVKEQAEKQTAVKETIVQRIAAVSGTGPTAREIKNGVIVADMLATILPADQSYGVDQNLTATDSAGAAKYPLLSAAVAAISYGMQSRV